MEKIINIYAFYHCPDHFTVSIRKLKSCRRNSFCSAEYITSSCLLFSVTHYKFNSEFTIWCRNKAFISESDRYIIFSFLLTVSISVSKLHFIPALRIIQTTTDMMLIDTNIISTINGMQPLSSMLYAKITQNTTK